MSPDEMANFHGEMHDWCEERADQADGVTAAAAEAWRVAAKQHLRAYRYWCRMANPAPRRTQNERDA